MHFFQSKISQNGLESPSARFREKMLTDSDPLRLPFEWDFKI